MTTAVAVPCLTDFLAPVSERIRQLCAKTLLRTMAKLTGEPLEQSDYRHHADTAAFEAFIDLGGNVDDPAGFDFEGQYDALVARAMKHLRRELVGRESVFGDIHMRQSARQNRAIVDGDSWSAWKYAGVEETEYVDGALLGSANDVTEQDRHLYELELRRMDAILRSKLTANEYRWLIERDRDGVSQDVQIATLVEADRLGQIKRHGNSKGYQGPDGRKRAETYINTTVTRARQKAAAILGQEWQGLLQEAA